jgi:hypothetical protein
MLNFQGWMADGSLRSFAILVFNSDPFEHEGRKGAQRIRRVFSRWRRSEEVELYRLPWN